MGKRQSKVRDNVVLLVNADPKCASSYNRLVVEYWKRYENVTYLSDIESATSAESITRAFRDAIKLGLINIPKDTMRQRREREKEFRQEYSGGKKQSYLDFTAQP